MFFYFLSIRQIDEYERGIKFRCGKYDKMLNPGWHVILPIFESLKKVDIRTKAVDVPEQDAITKDNVSIRINAVLYSFPSFSFSVKGNDFCRYLTFLMEYFDVKLYSSIIILS